MEEHYLETNVSVEEMEANVTEVYTTSHMSYMYSANTADNVRIYTDFLNFTAPPNVTLHPTIEEHYLEKNVSVEEVEVNVTEVYTTSHMSYMHSVYTADNDFLNFTAPPNLSLTIELMAFGTTLLTVCGFFTNCIAIGVLNSTIFDRMAYAVHMKILCLYNIIVLFLGALQHNSFYMDIREHTPPDNRRYFCTYLLWFVHVFRHARTASIILLLYNRIKAQNKPDVFQKDLEAVRFPILGNTLFLLVTTVYVSRYIDQLDLKTESYNRTECIFAFVRPFRSEITPDVMVSNMPIFEHCIIMIMLLIFVVKAVLKSQYISEPQLVFVSSTTTPPEANEDQQDQYPRRQSFRRGSDFHPRALEMSSVADLSVLHRPVSHTCIFNREYGVTAMTVSIVLLNTITSGLRDAPDCFMIDLNPTSALMAISFSNKCLLDLLFFAFLASMFFIMYVFCAQIRDETYNLLFNINGNVEYIPLVRKLSAESDKKQEDMDQLKRVVWSNQQLRPLEPPTGQRQKLSVSYLKSSDEVIARGSVWSLDKAYFLNATKKHAIIENF